jgi:AraC family transcriptional regulator
MTLRSERACAPAVEAPPPCYPHATHFAGPYGRALTMPAQRAPVSAAVTPTYHGGHLLSQRQKSWSCVSANLAEMHCDGLLEVEMTAGPMKLSVVLEQVGGRLAIRWQTGFGSCAATDTSYPMSVIPAGVAAQGRAEDMHFIRHLVLQFDVAALAGMAAEGIDIANAAAPRPMFLDLRILRLAKLFAEECVTDQPHSRLYGDNLSMALLLALSRLGASARGSIGRGRLAPWQVRRVTDYLVAHLADDISLQTVCDVVKLSRSHFSRAFKISTGLAPHQWLLQARIDKAKQLLLDTDRPLAQVAIDVGFADQAHLTRTFRRHTGESPGAWRRARGFSGQVPSFLASGQIASNASKSNGCPSTCNGQRRS